SCTNRCGETYFRGHVCHCDYDCLIHDECCKDYERTCTTSDSCKGRCGETFKRGRQCNCDPECTRYNQCCPDYEAHCGKEPPKKIPTEKPAMKGPVHTKGPQPEETDSRDQEAIDNVTPEVLGQLAEVYSSGPTISLDNMSGNEPLQTDLPEDASPQESISPSFNTPASETEEEVMEQMEIPLLRNQSFNDTGNDSPESMSTDHSKWSPTPDQSSALGGPSPSTVLNGAKDDVCDTSSDTSPTVATGKEVLSPRTDAYAMFEAGDITSTAFPQPTTPGLVPEPTVMAPQDKAESRMPLSRVTTTAPISKPVQPVQTDDTNAMSTANPPEYLADDNNDTNLCSGRPINGLTTLRNGTIVVFRGHYFWMLDANRVPGPARGITEVWGIPSPIDTVFTRCNCQHKTYFFKGYRYWRFENDVMDPGYPKTISDGFSRLSGRITAALSVPQNSRRPESVFFFKRGGLMQRYSYQHGTSPNCGKKTKYMVVTARNRKARQAEDGLHKEIKITWKGFPSFVTSAISIPTPMMTEGYDYYVFSRTKYYNIKIDGNTLALASPRCSCRPEFGLQGFGWLLLVSAGSEWEEVAWPISSDAPNRNLGTPATCGELGVLGDELTLRELGCQLVHRDSLDCALILHILQYGVFLLCGYLQRGDKEVRRTMMGWGSAGCTLGLVERTEPLALPNTVTCSTGPSEDGVAWAEMQNRIHLLPQLLLLSRLLLQLLTEPDFSHTNKTGLHLRHHNVELCLSLNLLFQLLDLSFCLAEFILQALDVLGRFLSSLMYQSTLGYTSLQELCTSPLSSLFQLVAQLGCLLNLALGSLESLHISSMEHHFPLILVLSLCSKFGLHEEAPF
ncbi:proteoglycan 4-like, partial [Scleropages formosus]